jgi:hypothetical protein
LRCCWYRSLPFGHHLTYLSCSFVR